MATLAMMSFGTLMQSKKCVRSRVATNLNSKWIGKNQPKYFCSRVRNFKAATAHIADFQDLIGCENVISDAFDIEKYTIDWTKVYKGGTVVCFPRSTEEVSKILQFCNSNRIAVVPQGGNTGLVGGGVGLSGDKGDQLILSMEKMCSIERINESVLICDAGCILENLNTECSKKGYIVPLDLGAKGACMIGGNVATNAGGLRVVRYGSLHGSVLGLEVVQADGTVLDMLRTLRKDNCGYHLPHLFIGSEGTLGVITKVAIALALKPRSTAVVWAKVSSFAEVQELLHSAKAEVGEILSAFEFVDESSLRAMSKVSPHLIKRIQESALPSMLSSNIKDAANNNGFHESGIPGEVCVLMEFSSSSSSSSTSTSRYSSEGDSFSAVSNMNKRLESFLEKLFENGLIVDALVSQNSEHERELWAIREDLPVNLMQLSRKPKESGSQYIKLYKYDVSLALSDTDAAVLKIKKEMNRQIQCNKNFPPGARLEFCCFGHAGDQNLHLNVLLHLQDIDNDLYSNIVDMELLKSGVQEILDRVVFETVISVNGSVSAEHGVGQQKRKIMSTVRSPSELLLMSGIKKILDPNGILNPGKVIPDGF